MNRIVLAILALFAGIAAQVSPAEARVRGETEIGSVLTQRTASRAVASVIVAEALKPARGLEADGAEAPLHISAEIRVVSAPVRIGPDRAHE